MSRRKRMPEYNAWCHMRSRCLNSRHADYSYYGGRGISVCSEWKSFAVFLSDMGRKPSAKHTLQRKNNQLGYSKSNCQWSLMEFQNRNKRTNILVTLKGETRCLAEWCRILGQNYDLAKHRISRLSWDKVRALIVATRKVRSR